MMFCFGMYYNAVAKKIKIIAYNVPQVYLVADLEAQTFKLVIT